MTVEFTIEHRVNGAETRTGTLSTPHGEINTPVFMPVGTLGSVRSVTPDELKNTGVDIILGNAYHLYLRPGAKRIRALGGLHEFMGWGGPILTDSGGYQVFSLAAFAKVQEEGVSFRSHIDGSLHFLTPQDVIEVQDDLGSDIMMPLDQPLPYDAGESALRDAMGRTHRWAEMSMQAAEGRRGALFGIIQGGMSKVLRQEAARFMASLDLPGYALGGLSVGEPKETTWAMLEAVIGELPREKPRYLMGVGSPEDLVEAVSRGADMFDCALPTRVARNGGLYTKTGRLNVNNARFKEYLGPAEDGCDCYLCANFSMAYLHHLFNCNELLGYRLATLHNLRFFMRLMSEIREAISKDSFNQFKEGFIDTYVPVSEEARSKASESEGKRHHGGK